MFNPTEAFMKAASGQPIAGPYLLTDMANDAVGILDALGIKQAHIVGASMGGMIAQTVAGDHPDKVLSLTSIMSTTGRPGLPPGKPEAMAVLTTPPANLERETRIAHAMKIWRTIGSQPVYAVDRRRTPRHRRARSRPQRRIIRPAWPANSSRSSPPARAPNC